MAENLEGNTLEKPEQEKKSIKKVIVRKVDAMVGIRHSFTSSIAI